MKKCISEYTQRCKFDEKEKDVNITIYKNGDDMKKQKKKKKEKKSIHLSVKGIHTYVYQKYFKFSPLKSFSIYFFLFIFYVSAAFNEIEFGKNLIFLIFVFYLKLK